jgi:CcmD family protein
MVNATNAELYRLVLADAPYVIAAYAVLWLALAGYVTLVLRRLMRLEKEITLLEETAERRQGGSTL